jgi:hypothetical protein
MLRNSNAHRRITSVAEQLYSLDVTVRMFSDVLEELRPGVEADHTNLSWYWRRGELNRFGKYLFVTIYVLGKFSSPQKFPRSLGIGFPLLNQCPLTLKGNSLQSKIESQVMRVRSCCEALSYLRSHSFRTRFTLETASTTA